MRNIVIAIATSSVLFAGRSSPIDAACSKGNECGVLRDTTVEKCISDANKIVNGYREKKKDGCDKIADAFEDLYGCASGLSCEDFKKGISSTECKEKQEAAEAVQAANAEDCGGSM